MNSTGAFNETDTLDENLRIEGDPSAGNVLISLFIFAALIGSQLGVLHWKKVHYKSYQRFTTIGLWIVPFSLSVAFGYIRFLLIWTLYSAVTAQVLWLATRKPLAHTTPKLVYRYFHLLYRVCFTVGLLGYVILLVEFFALNAFIGIAVPMFEFGILLLFYGLLFGVLSRDIVEYCSMRMAAAVGYFNYDAMPEKQLHSHICAICGESMAALLQSPPPADANDRAHRLDCQHTFHESCIRGWVIIGKQDMCPYCKEKVDMNQFKKNPWDTQQIQFLNLLDAARYLLVWQPCVMLILQAFMNIFKIK